jgi:uncharacterized OB-fold protein
MAMTGTPAIDGWFTEEPAPALLASRCTTCATVFFPPTEGFCRNPACGGTELVGTTLSPRGTVWSYTDARYQPPPPYLPRTEPYEPFALAAVELPEGLVVLGQVADGYGLDDLAVGADVEVVVETLYTDETGDRTIWRWRPVTALPALPAVDQEAVA